MIREAVKEDIPALLELGQSFFDASGYGDFTEYSEQATSAMFENLIDSEGGILMVLDVDGIKGMAGGLVFPFYMSGELTGQELFWWCEKRGSGLKLLAALEENAKEKGAKTFMMVSLDNLTPDRLDKIYTAKGYKSSEHTYIRRL